MAPTTLNADNLLKSIPTSYATCSLGSPEDSLPSKLRAISAAGFSAIELAFPDLLSYASSLQSNSNSSNNSTTSIAADDYPSICHAGEQLRTLCSSLNLRILMLQPFANFEGWPAGSSERADAWSRVRGWRDVMSSVGTDMLQVGSSDSEGISGDRDVLAADLRELADFLAERNMRVAYENWCWATHAPGWEDVWDVVKRVDRANVGLCLDTFQTAGGEWGDPRTGSGMREDLSGEELEKAYRESLGRLAKTVPKEKIFLLQISDAYKPPEPLTGKDESGLRPRGRWSHDFRPIPFDGGYLPIVQMTKAVLETGFESWFSMEVFDGGQDGKGRDLKALGGLEGYAKRAMESHRSLVKEACK